MELQQAVNILLSNLDKVEYDYIKNLIKDIDYTSVSHFKPIFEECISFFDEHGQFPDKQYLSAEYVEVIQQDAEFSQSVKMFLDNSLNKEICTFKAQESLSKGDVDSAFKVLEERKDSKSAKKSKIGLQGIIDEYDRLSEGPSGILLAIPEIDDLAKGCSYSTVTFIGAPPGGGKCVIEGTRVFTELGYQKIEDLCSLRECDMFAPLNLKVRGDFTSSAFYCGGYRKDLIRIAGNKFENTATPNHRIKVLTENGIEWVKHENLREGDAVLLDKAMGTVSRKEVVYPKWLFQDNISDFYRGYAIGFLLSSAKRTVIGLTASIPRDIYRAINRVVSFDFVEECWQDLYHARLSESYLRAIGFYEGKRVIPEWVYASSRETMIGFVSGVYDHCGLIGDFTLIHSDRNFLREVVNIFNVLGVFPNLPIVWVYEWAVTCQNYDVKATRSLIGKNPTVHKRRIPLSNYIREIVNGIHTNSKWLNYSDWELLREENSLDTADKVEELFKFDYDVIREVSPSQGTVFDLTVPESHAFSANGLIQHNTTTAISATYMNSVKNGFNSVYLTLEIAERDWWYSLLSRHSSELGTPLSAESIKKGLLSSEEREILSKVHEDLKENMKGRIELLTVEDFEDFSFTEMERKFSTLEEEMGELDIILVDYIQLFKFYRPKYMTPEEYCNGVIRFFGQFAIKANKGKGCVVVILSQVNREWERRIGKTQRAGMSAFAEFNEIERTAHLAVVLYASEQDKLNGEIGTAIVKNRTGMVREELQRAYCDFEHYLVGSSEFKDLFNLESLDLIAGDDNSDDLFN